MQLTHAGFLKAFRGPNGGYCLARPANKIRLIEIYELIEGRFIEENCLLGRSFCPRDYCILGGLVEKINSEVKDYLVSTKLSDVTEVSQKGKK